MWLSNENFRRIPRFRGFQAIPVSMDFSRYILLFLVFLSNTHLISFSFKPNASISSSALLSLLRGFFIIYFLFTNNTLHLICIFQLRGMKRDPELTFVLRPKPTRDSMLQGSESDESSTPRKLQKMSVFNRLMDHTNSFDAHGDSGDEAGNYTGSISPATPPNINNRNARRRKGIPHRAPFWKK